MIASYFEQPGEHSFSFMGKAGEMEAKITVPENPRHRYIAFLGHPHSLQGGTMNNKVVTTLARTFKDLGIVNIRFNFRGVGTSAGVYDAGIGEAEDMLALVESCEQSFPPFESIFAGFSFGSYVAYRAAAQHDHRLLISIAPPFHHYDYREFAPISAPWIVVQGEDDEVVPYQVVSEFIADNSSPPIELITFPETGHFFHGKLIPLKTQLLTSISKHLPL